MHADFRIVSGRILALFAAITPAQTFYIPGKDGIQSYIGRNAPFRVGGNADLDGYRLVNQELRGQ